MNYVIFGGASTPEPPSSPPSTIGSGSGFCNWGNDGTTATSVCAGGAEGGDWCNVGITNSETGCSGRWCTDSSGLCNWGNDDGTAAEGGDDWCNKDSYNCENGCSGRWCTYSAGFCNWGNDGTAATSVCAGGAEGGDWCNETATTARLAAVAAGVISCLLWRCRTHGDVLQLKGKYKERKTMIHERMKGALSS
jgi:hypothetical protein